MSNQKEYLRISDEEENEYMEWLVSERKEREENAAMDTRRRRAKYGEEEA